MNIACNCIHGIELAIHSLRKSERERIHQRKMRNKIEEAKRESNDGMKSFFFKLSCTAYNQHNWISQGQNGNIFGIE